MKTRTLCPIYASAAQHLNTQYLGLSDISDAIELIANIKSSGRLAKPHHLKERSYEQFSSIIDNGYALLGVRNEKGRLIAFASVSPTLDKTNSMTIRALSVHPDWMGKGIGTKLIQAAINWTQISDDYELLARVATDNVPSLTSFQKLGFKPISKGWDSDDEYWYYILSSTQNNTLRTGPSNSSQSLINPIKQPA